MRYLQSARVNARKYSASPGHSCLINDRRSRKTKHVVQYLWPVFRHVRMWRWVLSTVLASLLILTYITYVWQQELSDERCQISMRKSCFPRTWAVSCTQRNAATPSNHRKASRGGRERDSTFAKWCANHDWWYLPRLSDICHLDSCCWRKQCELNGHLSIHQRSQMMSFISLFLFFFILKDFCLTPGPKYII